ncbi:MAG: hypothetical protein RBR79_07755 [Bacteroidales bacterium]|nr:hypothetical protein [Bacteroidales bacterium]
MRPLELNIQTIDGNDFFRKDTNIVFYNTNSDIIKEIVKHSPKEYTLFVSFYYWCQFNRNNFDSIVKIAENSNVQLVFIDTGDWLYQNNSRMFFKKKEYYNPIFILDIEKYGYNFDSRKRWRNFVYDVCGEQKKLYGNLDMILFNSNGEIILIGEYPENMDKLNSIITT